MVLCPTALPRRAPAFDRAPRVGGERAATRPPRHAVAGVALVILLGGVCDPAPAQTTQAATTLAGANAHARDMQRLFPDRSRAMQATPPVILKLEVYRDPSGGVATMQPNGPTATAGNAFFRDLGTNGRTCFTCHQPQDGWTISAKDAEDRFEANADDPLFRLVDGATCPSDDVSTPQAKRKAYGLLRDRGLIRIGLPMPSAARFEILDVRDPYDCNTNPTTGLTSPKTGIVSVYRRPLPTTNLGFLSTIMWDGREPNLFSQAVDATLIHAQGKTAPNSAEQQQIVTFEGCTRAETRSLCADIPQGSGIFTAQTFDQDGVYLTDRGANGGPKTLSEKVARFFIGINDPFGGNPRRAPFNSDVFSLYDAWESLPGHSPAVAAREAIARGELIFDTLTFQITGVAGLNDVQHKRFIVGSCGTCHDTPSAGNHSVSALLNTGVAVAGEPLNLTGLPVFKIRCTAGPLSGNIFEVTDPGRALITGQCADIGKFKAPILRSLAARAPYFHNGTAAALLDVVKFYAARFAIPLTEQDMKDLAAFLNSL